MKEEIERKEKEFDEDSVNYLDFSLDDDVSMIDTLGEFWVRVTNVAKKRQLTAQPENKRLRPSFLFHATSPLKNNFIAGTSALGALRVCGKNFAHGARNFVLAKALLYRL